MASTMYVQKGRGKSENEPQSKGMLAYGQRQLDRLVDPETRRKGYAATVAFASDRPVTSAFIASHAMLSALPIIVFTSFALSTAVFAIISALVFTLFWTGVAVLFLVPALFVTSSIAMLVWTWAVASFVVGRWIYNRFPVSVKGDLELQAPGGKEFVMHKNGDGVSFQKHNISNSFDKVGVKAEVTEFEE